MHGDYRIEFLVFFGLLIGYFGRSLWLNLKNNKPADSAILRPTMYGWQDEEHTIPRGCCKPAVLGAPYKLGGSLLFRRSESYKTTIKPHGGICPDCSGVTEMYERRGESQWPDAWAEYCTGCGNMAERPKQVNLWNYAGR